MGREGTSVQKRSRHKQLPILWTDGSCAPTNPGPGGWAVVEGIKCLARGSEPKSTNQRMELKAMAMALDIVYIRHERTEIRADSLYALEVPKHAPAWKRNRWRGKSGHELKNIDLIQELWEAYCRASGFVMLTHVRGHQGTVGNELADKYANIGRLEGLSA